jgi:hypothetical protein
VRLERNRGFATDFSADAENAGFVTGFGSAPAAGAGLPWSLDAGSGKAVPNDATEWTALRAAASLVVGNPTALRRCNELSGNLLDLIGAQPLTPNATPLYDQSVTGWTRHGVGFNGGTSQRFRSAAYGNAATDSIMTLMYLGFTGAPAASSQIWCHGGLDDTSLTAGSGGQRRFRYRESANISEMVGTYTEPTVYPVVVRRNATASEADFYSDSEKISPTYGAGAGTAFSYGANAGTAATFTLLYAAEWLGASAEVSDANIKLMLQALGWTITWT